MTIPIESVRGKLPESWRVDLPTFEGPLDLLLQLIKVNEVDLRDIPIALICGQFHEYLEFMEELDLDIAGEYIYEAALLIQLKARLLLPTPSRDQSDEDPRGELVERLLEYQRIKEAAQSLAENASLRSGMWVRAPQESRFLPEGVEEGALDLDEASLYDLLLVFRETLQRYDREHPAALVYHGEHFPIGVQFDRFLLAVQHGKPYDLLDDLLALSCRAEAISAFLAILELSRLQLIRLHQTDEGDILLYRTTRQLAEEERRGIQG